MREKFFKPLKSPASYFIEQPGASEPPIPLDGARRGVFEVKLDGFCSFFDRKPPEEAEFNYLRLPRVLGSETAESHIDQKDIRVATGFEIAVGKRENVAAAALGGSSFPGMVHQNVAHHAGGDGEELSAALPIDPAHAVDAEIQLMHQRGGLERMAGSFASKKDGRQAPQFAVNQIG